MASVGQTVRNVRTNYEIFQWTKSDPEKLSKSLQILPICVSIALDGGNIVKSKTKVIFTYIAFKENPDNPEQNLIAEIINQL
jgi:hypothetical protein